MSNNIQFSQANPNGKQRLKRGLAIRFGVIDYVHIGCELFLINIF